MHACTDDQSGYCAAYVSFLPAGARCHLELELDGGSEGRELDLIEIAHHMLHWEEKLCAHLGLTDVMTLEPNTRTSLNCRGEYFVNVVYVC